MKNGKAIFGFALAAGAAPLIAVTVFLAFSGLLPEASKLRFPRENAGMVYLLALVMGVLPSAVFGGITLLVMKATLRPWPPAEWVSALGGLAAAALYCVVSTVVGFAPWGSRPMQDANDSLTIMACVLLSGVCAALIYAPFDRPNVERG